MQWSFQVEGQPQPQGSLVAVAPGVVAQSNKKLLPHRELIAWRAKEAGVTPSEGWVSLNLTFVLNRPKSVKRLFATVPPDLDKLVRAVGDALKGVAYRDDAQVTVTIAQKRYVLPEENPHTRVDILSQQD